MKKIAVLIPCHNEQHTIGEVVSDFRKYLPEAEIYVCDNACSDRTANVAKDKGAKVLYQPNLGKGHAVRTLFSRVDADIFILVDGDNTYNAKDALHLTQLIENGADMVIADRLSTTYFDINKRLFHSFGNKLVNKIINIIFKSDIKDAMSGYRGFSRRFVDNYPVSSSGFELETEMTIHALNYNYNIIQINSEYRNRPLDSHSKLNTYYDGLRILKTISRLFMNYKPLSFFFIIACFLTLVSLILFIPVLVEYVETGLVPRFPTLFVAIFLFFMSVVLVCVGLILKSLTNKHRFLYELLLLRYDTSHKIN